MSSRIALEAGRRSIRTGESSNNGDAAVEQDQQRDQSADEDAEGQAHERLPPIIRHRLQRLTGVPLGKIR
jgi:hypothetical protein